MTCERCDRLLERNARLIVALRHAIAQLHQALHDWRIPWTTCSDEACRAAVRLIEGGRG